MKCDMCGKEDYETMLYVTTLSKSNEGWVVVGKKCLKLMLIIMERNSMKTETAVSSGDKKENKDK